VLCGFEQCLGCFAASACSSSFLSGHWLNHTYASDLLTISLSKGKGPTCVVTSCGLFSTTLSGILGTHRDLGYTMSTTRQRNGPPNCLPNGTVGSSRGHPWEQGPELETRTILLKRLVICRCLPWSNHCAYVLTSPWAVCVLNMCAVCGINKTIKGREKMGSLY